MSRRQSADYKEKWQAAQREKIASALQLIESNMVTIPSGSFMMGSNNINLLAIKPTHRVHVGSFKMGKYEVTQGIWQAVMGNNPSRFKGSPIMPRVNRRQRFFYRFIQRLNQLP
jgi:formylglycine-generating enzyme required for sulfatase activity